MRHIIFAVLIISSGGCALGIGRVTPSPRAVSNHDSQGLTPSSNQSGVGPGMVRMSVISGPSVDLSGGAGIGLQVGVKTGWVFGSFGDLPMGWGRSHDGHADLIFAAGNMSLALQASYLVQSVEYSGGFNNGYLGPAFALQLGYSPLPAVGLYLAAGPTLGRATLGNGDQREAYGSVRVPGGRLQGGVDVQLLKSGLMGLGGRIELAYLRTATETLRGGAASFQGGSALAEIYFNFLP